MISRIVVPDLGATGEDVNLVEWLVDVGNHVRAGAPLFVAETDKASVEVEAFCDGYIRKILVSGGTQVELGAVVAIMADSMDEPLEEQQAGDEFQPEATAKESRSKQPREATDCTRAPDRIQTSPLARRLANEHQLDLSTITGSGSRGEIHERDVLKAVGSRNRDAATAEPQQGARYKPVSAMRKAIAKRTQLSKTNSPHFYVSVEIDMGRAEELRKLFAVLVKENGGAAPSVTDFVLRAVALALRKTPALNTSFQNDSMAHFEDIHVGLVVGQPEGMMVPVIRHADRKNLCELAAATRRLRAKAAAGELSQAELTGATFTVSNLGMFGVDQFIAVINPVEAAILALGAIRLRPAVVEQNIVPRPLMTATLSADHRAVDGIEAARFLGALQQLLENPLLLIFSNDAENDV